MNRRQIKNLLTIAACIVVYTTLTDAGKHMVYTPMIAANAREAWAESLSNDESAIFFSSAGPTSRVLVIDLSVADADDNNCDSAVSTLRQRQDFLFDAYAHGFRSISCTAAGPDGKPVTIEDNIVPPSPAPPVFPTPRSAPNKHDAYPVRVTQAIA